MLTSKTLLKLPNGSIRKVWREDAFLPQKWIKLKYAPASMKIDREQRRNAYLLTCHPVGVRFPPESLQGKFRPTIHSYRLPFAANSSRLYPKLPTETKSTKINIPNFGQVL